MKKQHDRTVLLCAATGTTKTYTYDANGNRTGFTLKRNGNTEINQTYAYDKLNRLVSVSENGTVIATYSYDSKGNRVQTVSNGIATEYAYNIANMLTSQTSGNKLSESYTYYLNGNQKSKTSNGQTTNYVYDKMNRLTRENDTVYTFDDFGNRKTMTEGEATTTYTYDLNNRLLESNEVAGDAEVNTKYFYDANGNQTTKAVMSSAVYDGANAGQTVSGDTNEYLAIYDYNCYNQLTGVDTNGVVSSYAYLPDGMRLSKTVGDNTTTFVYDGANIVEEITADGVNKYYRGIEIIKNDDNLYYLYNGQGDVAILTDSTGNTVASYIFDAYGNTDSENAVYNNFGYRGEYADGESGLIYLRARMYDPSTGRFINEDPIRDGLNWYVYCGGNPVMFVDPWGLADRYVNSDTSLLNMRSAPGTRSTVISTLPRGTTLDYQGNKTGVIDGHMWAEVSVNGQTGWVAATYLTDEAPSTTTTPATTNANGYIYPLASRHTLDPNSGGRMYGAPRGGGRLHAGMDLIVPSGTRVVAMTGGIVIENNKGFYAGTDALIVKNSDGTTVLYGEIKSSLGAGTIIKQGQTIGSVIANNATGASMLHIEYYTGEASGSIFGGGSYRRRSDLTSPMFIQYLP